MRAAFLTGQAGATLVVALIMLLLVTLLAAVSSTAVQTNLRVVGNIESRAMVENVADSAIAQLLVQNNTAAFAYDPQNPIILEFDASGDGTGTADEITVTSTRQCITIRPILNDALNIDDINDKGCYSKIRHPLSRCADVLWDVRVTALDTLTKAEVTVRQGLEVRTDVDDLASCT